MTTSGHTKQVHEFDKWISVNYNQLQCYCDKYHIPNDTLNDVYLNVRGLIQRSGLTQTFYQTYMKRSISNYEINQKKKGNGKHFVDYTNEDFTKFIEDRLAENDDSDRQTQIYREEIMELSKQLFIYLQPRYSEEWQFVFRCYYLSVGRFTYKKLTEMTGINKNKCTTIIQTMKKDIRSNFINWVNNDKRGNTGING